MDGLPVTVWTADLSATVDLTRCAGPRGGRTRAPSCMTGGCPCLSPAEIDLSESVNKARLYECCLNRGTPFDIYRWVNLADLAALWPGLHLPVGLRAEWGGALRAMGLLAAA